MKPTLWGPPVWSLLFACAWTCTRDNYAHLFSILFDHLEVLLPCPSCRRHYKRHIPVVHRRLGGTPPQTPEHAFRWLYFMKDEVNRTLRRKSIALNEFVERYALHGGSLDEVAVADAFVLMAIAAHHEQQDDAYVSFCHAVAVLLPVPCGAALSSFLAAVSRPIIPAAMRIAHHTRDQHSKKILPRSHYDALVD